LISLAKVRDCQEISQSPDPNVAEDEAEEVEAQSPLSCPSKYNKISSIDQKLVPQFSC
jgi:hypothetical protein